ncbi:MAG: 2-hydroxyacid dehydrogenase [Clostridia bacterium]|nr:2-hydroxyacid dehydrogenase [Clostridia bacterium]
MKIALLEPLGVAPEMIEELSAPIRVAGHEFVYYAAKTTDPEELIRRSAGCEAVMIANNPFPAQVVKACPELKLINVAFTGIDHVAQDACRVQGITICNAANYSNQTVAEMVIGLVIGLYRHLDACNKAVRTGGTSAGLMGREIAGRTVGIIGTGKIGLMTARLFQAFGAKVIAYAPRPKEAALAMGIEYMSLEDVMAKSDIVSVHTPNIPSTRGLISREMIALMKKDAVLINCARGPIVDSAALADALNEDRIAGAGVDVYNVEPPIPDSEPLLHAKNTLLAPHVAFLSEEAMVRRAHIAFANMKAYLDGKPENVVAY